MATGQTWAEVACKKPPPALPTECAVNLEQYSTPIHYLPPPHVTPASFHSQLLLTQSGWYPFSLTSPIRPLVLFPSWTYLFSKSVSPTKNTSQIFFQLCSLQCI